MIPCFEFSHALSCNSIGTGTMRRLPPRRRLLPPGTLAPACRSAASPPATDEVGSQCRLFVRSRVPCWR
jgi:hypothetical protein